MKFWDIFNVDGGAVSDADVKAHLLLWRDTGDAVGVIKTVVRCFVIAKPILDKDFDWFDIRFKNEHCSWLMSSLGCDLVTCCPFE